MALELIVPKVGESITEVQVLKWLVAEGAEVKRDQPVVSLETDKASVDVPAPEAGVISKILKKAGDAAKVGEVLALIEVGAHSAASPSVSAASPVASVTPVMETKEDPNAKIMPAARRAMEEAGLKAEQVAGSGPGGRILKEDVIRVTAEINAKTTALSGATIATTPEIKVPASPAVPLAPKPAASAPVLSGMAPVLPAAGARSEEIVPMSMLRRRVAERLVAAQQNAALLTTFNEVDMHAVMEIRKVHQEAFTKRHGIKLGFMSFFIKAAVDALRAIPQINAQIRGNDIIYHHYCDIGVAVGGGRGLVVPVLRNAERMGFAEIEKTIADFGARAKANTLRIEDLQGGTFTISNGGVYGSLLSTPIVNPPQSGVLGLHGIQDRPVARDGQVVIRPMMYLALTYDHRIVDGKEAVTFLKRIKDAVEDPARLLLEV